MAVKLGAAPPTYFTAFATGQGVGAANYVAYATDMDTNFVAIRTSVNALVDEVNAIQGPSALFAQDMLQINEPASPIVQGVIGEHSYRVSIGAPTTNLDVKKGQAMRTGTRVVLAADAILSGSGLGGAPLTAYVNVDANGAPTVSAISGSFVVASVAWSGAAFTSVTQVADIFFDGDEYADMLSRAVAGTWAAKAFRLVARRIGAIERLTGGLTTDEDGATIGPMVIPGGSAANPGLIPGNGAGTHDLTTGFYRQAADVVGFAAAGVERFRMQTAGLRMLSGSASTPAVSGLSSTGSGLFWPTSTSVAIAAATIEIVRAVGSQLLALDGSAAAPAYSFTNSAGMGMSRGGADILRLSTAGATVIELDAVGFVDFPLQARARGTRATAQNLANATLTPINFTAEDYDIGAFHDNVTNNDRFTVPTGGNGVYAIIAGLTFSESTAAGGGTANTGQREVAITTNGTVRAAQRLQATGAGDTILTVCDQLALVATDIVRLEALQSCGGTMDTNVQFLALIKLT